MSGKAAGILTLALLLGACGADGEAPAPASKRELVVTPRWEWSWPGAGPGFTMRVSLSIGTPLHPTRAEECQTVPAETRVLVNDRPATLVDAGGPLRGGASGTLFRGCKPRALAEVGPFTREEARAVRVRVEEGPAVAEADLGDVLLEAKLNTPAPARARRGDELLLDVAPTYLLYLWHAEMEWQEGGATRARGSFVRTTDSSLSRLRVVGGPGRVTLTLTGPQSGTREDVPRCDGFWRCQVAFSPVLGPLLLEVEP